MTAGTMADNQSNTSAADAVDAVDAADAQNQLLNEPLEHSTSEGEEAPSLWAKFTAKYLMGDCPYTVALDVYRRTPTERTRQPGSLR
jgi:hypothetical protein